MHIFFCSMDATRAVTVNATTKYYQCEVMLVALTFKNKFKIMNHIEKQQSIELHINRNLKLFIINNFKMAIFSVV